MKDPVSQAICSILGPRLSVTEIPFDKNLFECGATSLLMVQLYHTLQPYLVSDIDVHALIANPTLSEILRHYKSDLLLQKTIAHQPAVLLETHSQSQDSEEGGCRSHRYFSNQCIPKEDFLLFLSHLSEPMVFMETAISFRLFIWIREGAFDFLCPGLYTYSFCDDTLIFVKSMDEMIEKVFTGVNGPLIKRGQFAFFFVGKQGVDNHFIQLGQLTQRLRMRQASYSLGFCLVGGIDFEWMQTSFELEPDHCFLLGLVGGSVMANRPSPKPAFLE